MITKDELWEKLLSGKTDAAKQVYKMRRICKACSTPIVDRNKSGYCRECLNARGGIIKKVTLNSVGLYKIKNNNGKRVGECEAHRLLKKIAVKWLEDKGCHHISLEKVIGRKRAGKYSYAIFDVVGIMSDEYVAVECGGVRKNKLETEIKQVYVLPYGETTPYLLEPTMIVCGSCGHIIGYNKI